MYVNNVETVTSLNVKRGMLSLLQLSTQTGKRIEVSDNNKFYHYQTNLQRISSNHQHF